MTDPTPERRAARLLAELWHADNPRPTPVVRAAVRLIAEEVRAAEDAARAQPPPAPGEVAAEVREVLAGMAAKVERLVRPPTAEWAETAGSPLDNLRALHASMTALPPVPAASLARLLWLLGLSPGERRFVTAAADGPADFDGLAVFADWLEQEMRDDDAERVRKLTPRDGDVLVLRVPGEVPGWRDAAEKVLENLRDGLRDRGIETLGLALGAGWDLEALRPEALAGTGLCRAEDALYRPRPGQHINDAAMLAVEGGYAGLVFNDVVLARREGETAYDLARRYDAAVADRGRTSPCPVVTSSRTAR